MRFANCDLRIDLYKNPEFYSGFFVNRKSKTEITAKETVKDLSTKQTKSLNVSKSQSNTKVAERKSNPWVDHCKKYAAEKGCSYKQAISEAKESYSR